jgi:hypothetical protein
VRRAALFCLLWAVSLANLWAQDAPSGQVYANGDIMIRIGVGATFPLYVHAFNFSGFTKSPMKIGIKLGGGFDYYITSNFKMGASVGFSSIANKQGNYSFLVPVTMRADWEFHGLRFDFPIGVEAGVLFNRYRTLFAVNFILKPHVGAFYNITNAWSIGLEASFWLVPQIVWDDMSKSRVGGFADVMIVGRYKI